MNLLQLGSFVFLVCFQFEFAWTFSKPWVDGKFIGRIAYSADGNYNDEDDWAASAFALAMLHRFGLQDKLVHFDYNCILPKSDKMWEMEHRRSISGAIDLFNYDPDRFYDCQNDLDGAVQSIVEAVNASTADDPLYFILAGPMEVPYLGLIKADPEKRKYVYCISHNVWNDGYASKDLVQHNKRNVIPTGVTWIQIKDQNGHLSTGPFGRASNNSEWQPWSWLEEINNPVLTFLRKRIHATTRADCSDAGMMYFLLTGDEDVTISKVENLIKGLAIPAPKWQRPWVRLEAENFRDLGAYEIEYTNDRTASQRISIRSDSATEIKTPLLEPYLQPASNYDLTLRYFESGTGGQKYSLLIAGKLLRSWISDGNNRGWANFLAQQIPIHVGDMIQIKSEGPGWFKLDYLELKPTSPDQILLDDPAALPGQIIVAGDKPGFLKYNGGNPAYLCGPDNPEDFLFRGTLNPDGTRSNGGQEKMIMKMAASGVNAFHCQMFRMQICNIKNEGDDTHNPFVNHDPSKGLNEALLNQWDGWISEMEQNNIILHLEFYNDATDVEKMGWTLGPNGELHPEEKLFFQGIVEKFKHHKNIMWGLEESCNKLPRTRTKHFKKLASLIAEVDNHHHPIVQSFVIPEDPEGDFPGGGGTTDDYLDDPHIKVVTWLHLNPHKEDFEAQHQEYLKYYHRDSRHFVVMKNETYHHPRKGRNSRIYMWSCAMAGLHSLEAYHHAHDGNDTTLMEDGLIAEFFQSTSFHLLTPRDDLAVGSTKWVLARPGFEYVAYTYQYNGPLGLAGLQAGFYDLKWMDTITGKMAEERNVEADWGENYWKKPDGFGSEIVLSITKKPD